MPLKPYRRQPPQLWMISNPDSSGSASSLDDSDYPEQRDEGDIPGQMFDLLKWISTEIFVKEYTNHEVVTVFACLLEKCLKREAYSASQKQLMTAWLQKLKTLWNPPHIKKATDYKKRPFRLSESSTGSMLRQRACPKYRNASSVLSCKSGFNAAAAGHHINLMQQQQAQSDTKPEEPMGSFSPRRSMPEIKPSHQIMSQMKRNSYQEESKINVSSKSV